MLAGDDTVFRSEGLAADDLVFCSGTLLRGSLADLLDAAEAGGFRGLSLWPHHVEGARAEGASDAEIRARLADRGVAPVEVEPVLAWLPPGSFAPEHEKLVGPPPEVFFALAEALHAPSLVAVDGFGARASRTAVEDAFGTLCASAARHGLTVKLEFTPWSAIPDARTAWAIVEASGAANAGLVVDSWHHARGANDLAAIAALPGERVLGVQLNDAPAQPSGQPLAEESMHARRLPGEGDVDLAGLVHALRTAGCQAPLGVEVFSDALAGLPPDELGRRAGASVRTLRGQL